MNEHQLSFRPRLRLGGGEVCLPSRQRPRARFRQQKGQNRQGQLPDQDAHIPYLGVIDGCNPTLRSCKLGSATASLSSRLVRVECESAFVNKFFSEAAVVVEFDVVFTAPEIGTALERVMIIEEGCAVGEIDAGPLAEIERAWPACSIPSAARRIQWAASRRFSATPFPAIRQPASAS